MNIDYDLECTCDVGPFASCPACDASRSREVSKLYSSLNNNSTKGVKPMTDKDNFPMSSDVIVNNVILSYKPDIFHPSTYNTEDNDKDPAYIVQAHFMQDDQKVYDTLNRAVEEAIAKKWGDKRPKGIHLQPIRDPAIDYSPSRTGSKMDTDPDRYAGTFYFKASSSAFTRKGERKIAKPRPAIMRLAGEVIPCAEEDEERFYAGAFVHLKLAAFAGEFKDKNGKVQQSYVKFILKATILSNKVGERLSSRPVDTADSLAKELKEQGIDLGEETEGVGVDQSELDKLDLL